MKTLHKAPVVAFAAAAVALTLPAIASAQEREWDIGTYDQCLNDGLGKGYNDEEYTNHKALCCWSSGGDWNAAEGKCQAPPKDQPAQRPSLGQVSDLPRYTLEPSPLPPTRVPSGVITQTVTTVLD